MSQTFPQYVLSTYGKSVYQIKLEVAAAFFVAHHELGAAKAWDEANGFIQMILVKEFPSVSEFGHDSHPKD